MGRVIAVLIALSALAAGVGIYYFQLYAYYERLDPAAVELTATLPDGRVVPLPAQDVRAIDSDSSPIRFRACFTVAPEDIAGAAPYADPAPLVAPGWFDCFDADAVGAALTAGQASAYLGAFHVAYGIDRVIAVFPDGRAVAWHQINRCGTAAFDGDPLPEGCPPREDRS